MLHRPVAHARAIKSRRIVEPPTVDYDRIFAKQPLLHAPIEFFDDLYGYCHRRFQTYQSKLSQRWGIKDQQKLEALFYTNLSLAAMGLWQPNACATQPVTDSLALR